MLSRSEELKGQPDNPFDNPLIRAIDENDIEALRALLKEGNKPDLRYAFTGFGRNDTDPKILDLLVEYNALPEGVSLSTLKFVLFAMGNARILASDFWDKPDLNLNGCPEKQSPIALFARHGNVQRVAALIQLGVTTRPIDYLFLGVHPSHFMGCDLLHIDKFKTKISDNLAGKNKFLDRQLEEQCQIGSLLLSNPTNELDKLFTEEKEHLLYNMRFLPLFAWAVKDDRAALLDIPHFRKLFQEDKDSAKEAVVIAAAFGAVKFLKKAIQEGLLEKKDIQKACSVAAANGDNKLLNVLLELLSNKNEKSSSKGLTTRKVSGIYYFENFSTPLFWAVRNGFRDTVELLLKSGISADGNKDDFNDSYLQLAIRCRNPDIIKLLITYGANVNHKDILGKTALHQAAKQENIDILKILIIAGADINLADDKGHKPLNSIKNETLRKEINEWVEQRNKISSATNSGKAQTLKNNSLFSTSANSASLSTNVEIVGLAKADVLLALYNNAKFAGAAFKSQSMLKMMADMAPQGGNREIAEKFINKALDNGDCYVDYIDLGAGPRPIKADLSGFEFNSTEYDYYHGEKGYAATLINQLRTTYVNHLKNAPKDSFAYLLSRIGSAFMSKNIPNLSNDDHENEATTHNDSDHKITASYSSHKL